MTNEFMDKETWIKSRTDNPNNLGKDVWEQEYNFHRAVAELKDSCTTSEEYKKNIVTYLNL